MVAQQYEIATENCTHKNTHQYAGFNAYRDSYYKCEDCGAVSIVPCSPQEDTLKFGEVV